MKKSLVLLVLAFAVASAAQTAPQQSTPPAGGQQAGQSPAGQSGQPTGPTIKDPAEYNAYITALNQSDPHAKAQALEAFLQQYPNSVVKIPAIELLMASYQQAGDQQKTMSAAQRVLEVDANNLRALAVLTFMSRTCALQGGPNAMQCVTDAGKYGHEGLQAIQTAQPPAGVKPDDFEKLKTQTAPIFNSAVGLAALQAKNYPEAVQALSAALQQSANPDFTTVYQLAIAYLSQKPIDPKGLWWVAKAVNMAQGSPAQAQIAAYGKRAYTVYHGGADGWDQLVATATGNQPPADLNIAPAPTPAEQAAKLCETKQVKDMSFDEFQMIFTNNAPCVEQIWTQIKGKPIAFEGKVVETGKDSLKLAATYEDIQNNVADVTVDFPTTIPKSLMPDVGAMEQVQGTPVDYTATPFMIHMDHGAFVGKKTPPASSKAPARKGTTHKKK